MNQSNFSKLLKFKIPDLHTNLLQKKIIPCFWLVIISFWFVLPPLEKTDSWVWYYMVKNMPTLIPYLDLFDHKGPLLYAIYRIGYLLTGNTEGIYYLRHLSAIVSLFFAYRMLNLWQKSALLNILAILICFTYTALFADQLSWGGGLAENWALMFILISLYLFAKYCKFDKLNKLEIVAVGIGFGAVLLLKANSTSIWLAIFIVVFIKEYRHKSLKRFVNYLFYALIGLLLIISPFIIYYASKHALKAMWDVYILFNIFDYSPSVPSKARWNEFKINLHGIMGLLVLFIILKLDWLKKYKNKSKAENYFHLFEALFFSISILMLNISGRSYFHYVIPILPTFLLSISNLLNKVSQKLIDSKLNYSLFHKAIVFVVILLLPLMFLLFISVFLESNIIDQPIASFIWVSFVVFVLFSWLMSYIGEKQFKKLTAGSICFITILSIPLLYSINKNSIILNNPYIEIKNFYKNTKNFINIFKGEEFYPREMKLDKHSMHASIEDIVKDIKLNTTLDDKILAFAGPHFVPIYDLSGNKPSHPMFFIPSFINRPPLIDFLDTNPKAIVTSPLMSSYRNGEYELLVERYELLKTYDHIWGTIGLYKRRN